ncbi:MAG: phosphoribosyltransferase [Nannocystaceae bacterium]
MEILSEEEVVVVMVVGKGRVTTADARRGSEARPESGRTGQLWRSWRDSSVLINALSVAVLACQIPNEPLSSPQIALTITTWAFVAVALVNHLAPERWPRLTHVVKAAYTWLLFASIGPAAGLTGPWWPFALLVSAVDLLPLGIGRRAGGIAEGAGAIVRLGLVLCGFWLLRFPPWLVVVYLGCSALYLRERRRRIARGRRFDYGYSHCAEHVAVWIFLATLNAPRLDLALAGLLVAGILGSIFAYLLVLGVVTNVRLHRVLERDLPPWFDDHLRELLRSKSLANLRSLSLQHYFMKPFSPKILNRRVTWAEIDAIIAQIAVPGEFESVVGVASGGAFIARGVAERLGIPKVRYVRSELWSRGSFLRSALVVVRYYFGFNNTTAPRFEDEGADLTGERVLIVDDSVCTGATLASVAALCRARGAAHVESFVLFAHPEHPTDHYGQLSNTPLVWPWGWESD